MRITASSGESADSCSRVRVQVMARYGALFKLLLRLRRVEDSLHTAWSVMRSTDTGRGASNGSPAPDAARWLPLWRLRSQMAHFVNNLQIYLQVTESAHEPAC